MTVLGGDCTVVDMPWRKTPSHNVLVLSTRQQSHNPDITHLASPLTLLPVFQLSSFVSLNLRHEDMSMLSGDEKRGVVPAPHSTQQEAWRTIRAARLRFLVFAIAVVVLLANYGHRVVLTVNINTSAATAECTAAQALEATEWTTEDWDKVCHGLRRIRCPRRVLLLLRMWHYAGGLLY